MGFEHILGMILLGAGILLIWKKAKNEKDTQEGQLEPQTGEVQLAGEQKSFWKKLGAVLMGRYPKPCPYCHELVEYESPSCEGCGTRFVPIGRFPQGDRWCPEFNNINYDIILEEWGVSEEEYFEQFSKWESPGEINPRAFLQSIGIQGSPLPLEQVMLYLTYYLPKNPANYGEVGESLKKAGIDDSWFDEVDSNNPSAVQETALHRAYSYNHFQVDAALGGGWFPPYEYPVRVGGFFMEPLLGTQPFDIRRLLRGLPALSHDIFVDLSTRQKKYAGLADDLELSCFRLALSEEDNITANQMERFWSSLQTINHPVSFEIVGNGSANTITFQLLCNPSDQKQIANQLVNLFPNSPINPEGKDPDALAEQVTIQEDGSLGGISASGNAYGLANHYSYQLRTLTTFDKTDPLHAVINPLGDLEEDEGVVIQALISPTVQGWQNHLNEIIQVGKEDSEDETGFKNCPASQKLRYQLLGVCLRVMAFTKKKDSPERLDMPLNAINKAMVGFRAPEGNHITMSNELLKANPLHSVYVSSERGVREVPAAPAAYHEVKSLLSSQELLSVLNRQTYRHGFIFNTQELATLCHFPHKDLEHPKLLRQSSAFAQAPEAATTGKGLLIGINEIFGKETKVYIPEDFRFRHTYVVGKTGTGKTTFLYNMLKEDIEAGKGVGLIDPHGDLVEQVLQNIPEHRIDDVILFDPSDDEQPIGFNMFQVTNLQEKRQIRTDILTSIKRLFDESSWSDNIDQLFRAAIATLLEDESQTHTLLDIRRLVSDDVFRSQVISRINDDFLQEFWREDFTGYTPATIAAMRRRLGSILNEPEVRNVLAQPDTTFSFKEMMNSKKIFLAKLSRGILGEDMSKMFGGLLVSKIQLQAMARASQPEHLRVPFYLYVDEFQNFVNESFEVILAEARKYRLCLTMAHQFTGQLPKPVYDAVFGNVGTLIAFETGVDDATALEKQLGKFSRDDIINLPAYHTFTRIGKAADTFSMRTMPPNESETDMGERARTASREKYGRPVKAVASQPEPEPIIDEPIEPEEPQVAEPEPGQEEKQEDKKSIDFFE